MHQSSSAPLAAQLHKMPEHQKQMPVIAVLQDRGGRTGTVQKYCQCNLALPPKQSQNSGR